MKWFQLTVFCFVVCVVKCSGMSKSELEDFADHLEKTSKLDVILLKGNPDYDYDEDEKFSDYAWEDSGKFEGDIVLNDRQRKLLVEDVTEGLARNGLRDSTKRWPNNEVVYYIQKEHFNSDQVQAIMGGIEDLQQVSCIKFRPYQKGDRNAVVIQGSRRGCFSQVGYQGGYQVLNLSRRHPVGRGCFRHGTVVHELLHSLGFYHMQSSPDRDDYIDVLWENIIEPARHNFRKYNSFSVSDFGVGYDYDSVLHYSRRAFSVNGKDTLVPKQSGVSIGQRSGLSDKDAKKLNKMYCDADSSDSHSADENEKQKATVEKKPKSMPFQGHGIGYHQGKTVAIKVNPEPKTYKITSTIPRYHVFDHFSTPPQALSPTTFFEETGTAKEIKYEYTTPNYNTDFSSYDNNNSTGEKPTNYINNNLDKLLNSPTPNNDVKTNDNKTQTENSDESDDDDEEEEEEDNATEVVDTVNEAIDSLEKIIPPTTFFEETGTAKEIKYEYTTPNYNTDFSSYDNNNSTGEKPTNYINNNLDKPLNSPTPNNDVKTNDTKTQTENSDESDDDDEEEEEEDNATEVVDTVNEAIDSLEKIIPPTTFFEETGTVKEIKYEYTTPNYNTDFSSYDNNNFIGEKPTNYINYNPDKPLNNPTPNNDVKINENKIQTGNLDESNEEEDNATEVVDTVNEAIDRLGKIIKTHVYPSQTPDLDVYKIKPYDSENIAPTTKHEPDSEIAEIDKVFSTKPSFFKSVAPESNIDIKTSPPDEELSVKMEKENKSDIQYESKLNFPHYDKDTSDFSDYNKDTYHKERISSSSNHKEEQEQLPKEEYTIYKYGYPLFMNYLRYKPQSYYNEKLYSKKIDLPYKSNSRLYNKFNDSDENDFENIYTGSKEFEDLTKDNQKEENETVEEPTSEEVEPSDRTTYPQHILNKVKEEVIETPHFDTSKALEYPENKDANFTKSDVELLGHIVPLQNKWYKEEENENVNNKYNKTSYTESVPNEEKDSLLQRLQLIADLKTIQILGKLPGDKDAFHLFGVLVPVKRESASSIQPKSSKENT